MWLALSAGLLLLASLAWYLRLRSWDTRELAGTGHAFLSPGWWDEPVVRGADAALPEISGKIFGVALQNVGAGHRLWIVGPVGFLAYSDDELPIRTDDIAPEVAGALSDGAGKRSAAEAGKPSTQRAAKQRAELSSFAE